MSRYPFRPAQGWVFVDMGIDVYNEATIFEVGTDIDKCVVGRDVLVRPEKPIDLPLGGMAVRFSEVVIISSPGGFS